MIDWKIEPLPIHGYRIVNLEDREIVRDIYQRKHADQIVKEHNAVMFARRYGDDWTLIDWRNWLINHAIVAVGEVKHD